MLESRRICALVDAANWLGASSGKQVNTNNDSLTFLIAEYSALREEILKRTEIQHQLIAIALVASGTFLSLSAQIPTTVGLAYPVLALFLSAAWSQSDIRIRQIGEYIKDHIEKRLMQEGLLDPSSGWEHDFERRALRARGKLVTLSQLVSYGILIGTQILAVLLFLFKTSFTKKDICLLVLDCLVILFSAFLLGRSRRWLADI